MRVITDYALQHGPYADHIGECVVELADGETIEDVIEKYTKPKREWWERQYSDPKEIGYYKGKMWDTKRQGYYDMEFTGRLVKMTVMQAYLD